MFFQTLCVPYYLVYGNVLCWLLLMVYGKSKLKLWDSKFRNGFVSVYGYHYTLHRYKYICIKLRFIRLMCVCYARCVIVKSLIETWIGFSCQKVLCSMMRCRCKDSSTYTVLAASRKIRQNSVIISVITLNSSFKCERLFRWYDLIPSHLISQYYNIFHYVKDPGRVYGKKRLYLLDVINMIKCCS